jgi:hypothetical protein
MVAAIAPASFLGLSGEARGGRTTWGRLANDQDRIGHRVLIADRFTAFDGLLFFMAF